MSWDAFRVNWDVAIVALLSDSKIRRIVSTGPRRRANIFTLDQLASDETDSGTDRG